MSIANMHSSAEPDDVLVLSPQGAAAIALKAPLHNVGLPMHHKTREMRLFSRAEDSSFCHLAAS